ncbi:hypothetical protein BS78_10G210100 [Paspalum vaginatum]|nr:hypothetical protein BS78_10G210100 [Paspalum vaginatum]
MAGSANEQRSAGVRHGRRRVHRLGSWLVRKLLQKGYTVHATLRNTGDEEKAGLLRRLVPGAADRLRLFEADLFDAATFAPAIAGCQFVFLLATPFGLEGAGSKYKSTAEATVDAARAILRQCEGTRTVRRVIHTASISTASPLKEAASGAGARYKDFISESCWTPLNVHYPLRSAHFDKYILSKLRSEQELLSHNAGESPAFEVVTLPLGLVAGDTVLGPAPETLEGAVAPVSGSAPYFGLPRILQQLLGSLLLVICVCCCDRLDLHIRTEAVARVQPEGDKLGEMGFRYKYGMEAILDSSLACAVRLGSLDTSKLKRAERIIKDGVKYMVGSQAVSLGSSKLGNIKSSYVKLVWAQSVIQTGLEPAQMLTWLATLDAMCLMCLF